jgi:hypothetical protein
MQERLIRRSSLMPLHKSVRHQDNKTHRRHKNRNVDQPLQ